VTLILDGLNVHIPVPVDQKQSFCIKAFKTYYIRLPKLLYCRFTGSNNPPYLGNSKEYDLSEVTVIHSHIGSRIRLSIGTKIQIGDLE